MIGQNASILFPLLGNGQLALFTKRPDSSGTAVFPARPAKLTGHVYSVPSRNLPVPVNLMLPGNTIVPGVPGTGTPDTGT